MEKQNNVKKPALFTDEELAQLNFTETELADLEAAEAFSDVVDLLPSDDAGMDALFDKIDKTFPNDFEGAFTKMGEIAKNDPKFYAQILALTTIIGDVKEEEPAKVEKISVKTIKSAQNNDRVKEILKILADNK